MPLEFTVVLTGNGTTEEEESNFFTKREYLLNLVGKISISELVRCLSHARLVISNDTI